MIRKVLIPEEQFAKILRDREKWLHKGLRQVDTYLGSFTLTGLQL